MKTAGKRAYGVAFCGRKDYLGSEAGIANGEDHPALRNVWDVAEPDVTIKYGRLPFLTHNGQPLLEQGKLQRKRLSLLQGRQIDEDILSFTCTSTVAA